MRVQAHPSTFKRLGGDPVARDRLEVAGRALGADPSLWIADALKKL
ncbi:MAG: hypothetical protein ACI9MR_002485 [Myxococcota bacterium]|jgi:hypothetical protein